MTTEYGFIPVLRSQEKLLKEHNKDSPYISIDDIAVPDTQVVQAVEQYVKKELSPETFRHSVRAYYYGMFFQIAL